jgi:hypothetical protein
MDTDLLRRIRGEIDDRLSELQPVVEEYEWLLAQAGRVEERAPRARGGRSTGGGLGAASRNGGAARRGGAPRGAAQQAIVAALEHGSHTVSELAVVTGMRGPGIRENLRRLLAAGAVTRGRREGKAAYELS